MGIWVRERRIKLTNEPVLHILHSSPEGGIGERSCFGVRVSGNLNPGLHSVRRMNEGDGKVSMKLRTTIALLLVLAPSLAFAKPRTATAHMRPQLFRDRAPKARTRDFRPRETHATPSKVQQPAPPQKDDQS
jgi:hypothetical protein